MRAGTVVDIDGLLDELEFRLMRCASALGAAGTSMRKGGVLTAGESAHRIARNETRSFWNEHRLAAWSDESLLQFKEEMLARPPRYLAWALVPLFAELAPNLINDDLVERIVEWIADGEPVERVVRDAVTLTILVKCLVRLPEQVAIGRLAALCDSLVPNRIRMGGIGLGAYLREPTKLSRSSIDTAFAACLRVAARADTETAVSVGWGLRELMVREPERLSLMLEKRIQLLSRQCFRTAVERLDPELRANLTERWLAHRRRHKSMLSNTRVERARRLPS